MSQEQKPKDDSQVWPKPSSNAEGGVSEIERPDLLGISGAASQSFDAAVGDAQAWSEAERAAYRQQVDAFESEVQPRVELHQTGRWASMLPKLGLIAMLGFWIAFNVYKFDYVVILPGGTDVVNDRISIKSASALGSAAMPQAPKTYPAEGKMMWATVGVKRDVRGLDLLMGWLKADSDVFHREDIYGKVSNKVASEQSREEMDDAKLIAKILAARKLGIATIDGGAEVLDREKKQPVEKLLADGEVITAADGKPICLSGDLRELMLTKKPGDSVTLTVMSAMSAMSARSASARSVPTKTERTVVVPLHKARGFDRQVMGVVLGPARIRPCRLPFDVEVNTERIGGPSAGLAMTLALIDRLSPGELTGGGKVAATGTIEADGSVGQIGGVKQKTASVKASGAKLFIVPIEEVALAKPHAGNMQVVGVRNLDEALAALRKAGGDPLPSPSR